MNNESKFKLIERAIRSFLGWGIGAILMVMGAVSMTFYNKLNMEFPYWLIVGAIEIGVGLTCWILDTLLKYKKDMVKLKKELENKKG